MAADVAQQKCSNNKFYASAFRYIYIYIYIDEVQFGIAQLYSCLYFELDY